MPGFNRVVQWLACHNPVQMLDILRAGSELGCAMDLADLKAALDAAHPRLPLNQPLAGWESFWRGYSLLGSHLVQAKAYFRLARERAVEARDYPLVALAVFWEGACLILMGKIDASSRLVQVGTSILDSRDGGKHLYKVENLRAHTQLHAGEGAAALETLERLDSYGHPSELERASDEALRALYLISDGQQAAARRALALPHEVLKGSGSQRLKSLCELTSALIDASESPKDSPAVLQRTALAMREAKNPYLEVYARESLAVALYDTRCKSEAKTEIDASRNLRQGLKMAYTAWDQRRFTPQPATA